MFEESKNIIDVIKYKWVCVAISSILIVPGIVAMIYLLLSTNAPFKLGIDFTGGTIVQYNIQQDISPKSLGALKQKLVSEGLQSPVIQEMKANESSDKGIKNIISIRTAFLDDKTQMKDVAKINNAVSSLFGEADLISTSSVGPTLSKELFKNSFFALILAFAGIVGYLTLRFKLDYAVFALLALLHDALSVCGIFAIMGIFYNTQVDSLFITAILTVIGFSVHDTIVVYDRIRENNRFLAKKKSFTEIVNISVNQTLARSINTSLTSVITLLALYFFGGVSTKEFVLAMTLGIIIGTYSSIFFASMWLADHKSKLAAQKA